MAAELENEFRWQTLLNLAKKSSKIVEIIQKEHEGNILVKFEKILVDFLNSLTQEEQKRIEERSLIHIGAQPTYLSDADFKLLKDELEAEDFTPEKQFRYAETQKDEEKKIKWFTIAAQNGHLNAQSNLGYLFLVKKNYKDATFWLKKAVAQGCKFAQNNLGHCYCLGHGVDRDISMAIDLFTKSANSEHARAQFNLAECYQKSIKDEKQAFKWYKRAANNSHGDSCFIVGTSYLYGVKNIVQKNETLGFTFLREAARYGRVDGMVEIGNYYLKKEQFQRACDFYSCAAEKGNTQGMVKLGECYQNGVGVQQNIKQAIQLYTNAATQNNLDAKLKLGICYLNGDGVEKDVKQALAYFLASTNGDEVLSQSYLKTYLI